jgi:hypothetical protein
MPLSFLAATIISAAAIAISARSASSTFAWRAAVISVAVVTIGASIALFSMTTGPKLQVAAPAAVARGFAIAAGLAAAIAIGFALLRLPRQSLRTAAITAATLAALLTITYWQIVDNLNVNPNARNVTIYRARSFFGLVSVQHRSRNDKQWENYTFKSGHVPHGKEYADPARRSDTRLAYWGPDAGSRLAIEYKVQQQPHCRIGVVGLGIGTIAGFAKEGDYVRLYEINPQVTDIAKRYFHFLPDCKAPYDVVHGDARLKLEQELKDNPAGHQFDLLCLDAFSGDAVPTHLLTTEAFAIYKKHLKPDGIIVCNITNTYLDLWPVIKRLADEHSFKIARVYRPTERETLVERTYFALVTNDEGFLGPVMTGLRERLHDQLQNPDERPGPIPEALVRMPANFQKKRDIPLWTDRYHNLFQVLR